MQNNEIIKAIFSNGAVWGALILLVTLIVQTYFPQVPQEIIDAATVLAIAVLGAVGVYNVGARVGYVRAMDEQNK